MRKAARDKLIDEVMEAYVDWRQVCLDVESAYRRWSLAASTDPVRAFAAYRAAVNGEELAAIHYEVALQRATTLFARDRRRRSRPAPRHGARRRRVSRKGRQTRAAVATARRWRARAAR